jgi:hypothetical protein
LTYSVRGPLKFELPTLEVRVLLCASLYITAVQQQQQQQQQLSPNAPLISMP